MEHPITPPPGLVQQWDREAVSTEMPWQLYIATQAARWGDDQRLEAIIHWLITGPYGASIAAAQGDLIHQLRDAMRPKPPSLKEQALAVLDDCSDRLDAAHENTIRRALEALSDD